MWYPSCFQSKWRGSLFDFIQTKYFEFFIMSVIMLNMVTMMIQHYKQSTEISLALEYLNYVFTGIFTFEAVIRLIAMRLEYFKSGMNVFDFVIVVFSIAGKQEGSNSLRFVQIDSSFRNIPWQGFRLCFFAELVRLDLTFQTLERKCLI